MVLDADALHLSAMMNMFMVLTILCMAVTVGCTEINTTFYILGSELGQQFQAQLLLRNESVEYIKITSPKGIWGCECKTFTCGDILICHKQIPHDQDQEISLNCSLNPINEKDIYINVTISQTLVNHEGQWTAEVKKCEENMERDVEKNATFTPHLHPNNITLTKITNDVNGRQKYIFVTGCMYPKPSGTIFHQSKTFCDGDPVVDIYRSDTCPWGSKEYSINCTSDVPCRSDVPKDLELSLQIDNEILSKIEVPENLKESLCTAERKNSVAETEVQTNNTGVKVGISLAIIFIIIVVVLGCICYRKVRGYCSGQNRTHRPDPGSNSPPGLLQRCKQFFSPLFNSEMRNDVNNALMEMNINREGNGRPDDGDLSFLAKDVKGNDPMIKKDQSVMSPRSAFNSESAGTTKIKRVCPLNEPSKVQQEKMTNSIGNTQRERGNTLNVGSQAPKEKAENAKGQQQQKTGIPHDLEKLTLDIDIASESHSDGITQASGIIVENQAVYQWHPYQDFECVTPYDGGLVPLDNHAETRTEEQKLDEVPSSADSDETNIKAVIEESEPKIEASIQSQEQKEEHEEMMSSETPAMTDKEAVAEANEPELEASIESQEQKEEHDEMMSPVIPAVTDKEAVAETNEPELEASIESQEQNEEHDEMMSSVTPAVTDKEAVAEANEPELEASIESQEQKEEHDEMMSSETPAETNNQAVVDSDQNWLMKFWFDGSIRKRILRSEGKKCTGAIRMGREIPPDSNIFKYLYLLWYISVYLETLCERRRIEDKVNLEMLRYGQPHGMVNHQSPTCQYSELPIFLLVVNYGY